LAVVLVCLVWSGPQAVAMDRWEALSQLESGNSDAAIGRAGEISRFQILPALWEKFANRPLSASKNPQAALCVARAIMRERCAAFERRHHRLPTNFEYYVLWNAPGEIERPTVVVAARARRFCHLMGS
jgi:hypothetical protein